MHLPAVNPARTTCRQPRDISNLSPYRQRHTQSTWNSSPSFSQISHLSLFPKTISDDDIQPFDESSADWRSGEPNNKRYAQPSSAVCLSFILQFPAQKFCTQAQSENPKLIFSLFSIPLFNSFVQLLTLTVRSGGSIMLFLYRCREFCVSFGSQGSKYVCLLERRPH